MNDLQSHRLLLDAIAAGEPEMAKRAFNTAATERMEQVSRLYTAEREETQTL